MSKVIGTYTGRFDVFRKICDIKIQIISVPKQKNKIVMTGQPKLFSGFSKDINGSLLSVKKLIHDEKSLGWKLRPTKMYGISISYQNRGSHQGGPMHNFKDNIALFSKDEKHIDKLLKFLEKHITKKKVRRTKNKSKKSGCGKGGGKKGGVSKKNKYISNATLKSLQKLSYHDLKNLSSSELQKYKKRVGIVDQEGNPFTDEDLIRVLRKYISGKKIKTKQLTWRAQQHEKIKQKLNL
tara:strand:+ start:730 stop:1443 length:714 start_codon:yes stop_codon:yes gene_type:complete